jgi:hypothetical protein
LQQHPVCKREEGIPVNICIINDTYSLANAFRALGHDVRVVVPDRNITTLSRCLDPSLPPPDLLLQQERMGDHVMVEDVEDAPCPTLFLSIDAHQNLYWQRHYARLFDGVLTPHVSLFEALPPPWRHPVVIPCAWPGRARPWRPFPQRRHDLAFCGRLTGTRPTRTRMVNLLQERCGLELRQDIPFEAMMEFYEDSRMVPNESICLETNFRLIEAASCGALVLAQRVGPDQDRLLRSDAEVVLYGDGQELLERIGYFRRRPEAAERIGRAAWERVNRDHLPEARAARICAEIPHLGRHRAEGKDARRRFWLTILQHKRNGWTKGGETAWLKAHDDIVVDLEDGILAAGTLRLQGETGDRKRALDLCRAIAAHELHADSLDCNCAASFAALLAGDFPLARFFLLRQASRNGASGMPLKESPTTAGRLCLAWGEVLQREGRLYQPGFIFCCNVHMPETAMESLIYGHYLEPRDVRILRRLEELCRLVPAFTEMRMGLLAERCLLEGQTAWLQREYGKSCLEVFRVEEGLEEIAMAGP